jgi:hypothetical protein
MSVSQENLQTERKTQPVGAIKSAKAAWCEWFFELKTNTSHSKFRQQLYFAANL